MGGVVKLNLLMNNNDVRAGYINIDPYTESGDPDKVFGILTCLDQFVEDAEATDILALDIIDFLPASVLDETLTHWLKKLRHGGTITFGGVDLGLVAKGIVRKDLSLIDANILLYGGQETPWNYRKLTLSLQDNVNMLLKNNMKILEKKIVDFRYIVKAQRL